MRMRHDDIFVHFESLPYDVHGYTHPNSDGTFTIILNTRDSFPMQEWTKLHEIEHIDKGDYDNAGILVDALELCRHGR